MPDNAYADERDNLLLALKKLDQTTLLVGQIREAVRNVFRDLAAAQSPEIVRQSLADNIAQVSKPVWCLSPVSISKTFDPLFLFWLFFVPRNQFLALFSKPVWGLIYLIMAPTGAEATDKHNHLGRRTTSCFVGSRWYVILQSALIEPIHYSWMHRHQP